AALGRSDATDIFHDGVDLVLFGHRVEPVQASASDVDKHQFPSGGPPDGGLSEGTLCIQDQTKFSAHLNTSTLTIHAPQPNERVSSNDCKLSIGTCLKMG